MDVTSLTMSAEVAAGWTTEIWAYLVEKLTNIDPVGVGDLFGVGGFAWGWWKTRGGGSK